MELVAPRDDGYLMLAATVGDGLHSLSGRRRRRNLVGSIAHDVADLAALPYVIEADLFTAQLVAPGMGKELLRQRSSAVTPADFDVVLLVRTNSPADAQELRADATYVALHTTVEAAAHRTHELVARNVRRIADVDHTRHSVYLFNFFYADDAEKLLPVWKDTARWFVDTTHLPDSVVLEPLPGEPAEYGIINHASWPNYRTFLPHLALRPSFRSVVLACFESNGIAAQPILYRRVATR